VAEMIGRRKKLLLEEVEGFYKKIRASLTEN
jgi:hypothetical protein